MPCPNSCDVVSVTKLLVTFQGIRYMTYLHVNWCSVSHTFRWGQKKIFPRFLQILSDLETNQTSCPQTLTAHSLHNCEFHKNLHSQCHILQTDLNDCLYPNFQLFSRFVKIWSRGPGIILLIFCEFFMKTGTGICK